MVWGNVCLLRRLLPGTPGQEEERARRRDNNDHEPHRMIDREARETVAKVEVEVEVESNR